MHTHYVFDPVLFLGIVGAIAAVASATFAWLVWKVYKNQLATMIDALKETRGSNEIAEKALVLGRRAWLVGPRMPEMRSSQGFWMPAFKVENISDMPAIIQRYAVDSGPGKTPEKLSVQLGEGIRSGRIVARGNPVRLETPKVSFPAEGDAWMTLVVEYSDCFGKTWRTTVSWEWSGPTGARQVSEGRSTLE